MPYPSSVRVEKGATQQHGCTKAEVHSSFRFCGTLRLSQGLDGTAVYEFGHAKDAT